MDELAVERERRWIVVVPDGRYVTLGRATDPTPDEIEKVELDLASQGMTGWLAIMAGSPHSDESPELMGVRPLAGATEPFDVAARACRASFRKTRTGC